MRREQAWTYSKIGAALAACLLAVSCVSGQLTGFHAIFGLFAICLGLVVARVLTRPKAT